MNEQSFRPAWRSFYWHFTAMIACLVVVSLLSAKAHLTPAYQKGIWIFFLVFVLCAAGDMLYRRLRVLLIVKSDEIALEQGLIGRHSVEISTKNIRTIQIKQSLMQRLLNVGDILVASSGTDGYEIYINNMPDPNVIRDMMQVHERAQVQENGEEASKPA